MKLSLIFNQQFKQPQIKVYNLKDKGQSVSQWILTMILFQMEEVWVSFGITDNIHLKGHTYLISSHDGKAQRGQDILDQKGGKLAEDLKKKTTSKSVLLGSSVSRWAGK